jgi:hypothetical protein
MMIDNPQIHRKLTIIVHLAVINRTYYPKAATSLRLEQEPLTHVERISNLS